MPVAHAYFMLGNYAAISLLSVAEPHHLLENKCGKAAFALIMHPQSFYSIIF